jgi:two-component system cell cycle sensor histidine kinase/response regulator CckA
MDIVKRHEGRIEVETEVGAGTVFRIFLPIVQPEEVAQGVPEAMRKPKVSKGTILLVEDESNVREFAAAVLQQEGYTILQAKSAEGALEVWHWHNARIGLLLTDVVLPGELSGVDLGRALQEERPALKVLLTTGYNRETIAPQAGSLNLLNKPYTPQGASSGSQRRLCALSRWQAAKCVVDNRSRRRFDWHTAGCQPHDLTGPPP